MHRGCGCLRAPRAFHVQCASPTPAVVALCAYGRHSLVLRGLPATKPMGGGCCPWGVAFRKGKRGGVDPVFLHFFIALGVRPSVHFRAENLQLKEVIEAGTFAQERAPGTSVKFQFRDPSTLAWRGPALFRWSRWRFAARWPMESAAFSLLD